MSDYGAMYFYGRIDYSSPSNGDLIYLMHGLGRVKLWQGSVGVEDVTSHLLPHLSLHSTLRTCSSDTTFMRFFCVSTFRPQKPA